MQILNVCIELANPFDRWDCFKNLGCLYGKLSSHVAWELEHSYYSPLLVDFKLRWSTRTDHAGFEFGIGAFGYGIHFRVYDIRHWNYTTNRWEEYNFDEYFKTDN